MGVASPRPSHGCYWSDYGGTAIDELYRSDGELAIVAVSGAAGSGSALLLRRCTNLLLRVAQVTTMKNFVG